MGARQDAYQDVTDRIVAALEAGTVPWHQPWRSTGGQRSYAGRPYRGVNVWLLELAAMDKCYTDPRWVTFNKCKDAGGSVRKGERGTVVYFWKRSVVPDLFAEPDDDGEQPTRSVFWMRAYHVFNVEQCEGLDAWVPVERHEDTDGVVARTEWSRVVASYLERGGPKLQHGGDRACYSPSRDTVTVPRCEAFESTGGAYYGTLFHELAHSTGHRSRLDRDEVQALRFGDEPYAREELVAELAAAMLCGALGVDRGRLDASASYIAAWLGKLRDDRRFVVSASSAAQKAADMVLGTTFEDRPDDRPDDRAAAERGRSPVAA